MDKQVQKNAEPVNPQEAKAPLAQDASAAQAAVKPLPKPKRKRSFRKPVKILIILLVIAAVIGGIWWWISKNASIPVSGGDTPTTAVARGRLDVKITGSGVMEPMEKYDIVPMVQGTIQSAPFEEGELVSEGALLYTFDDSDIRISIEKTRNSMKKAKIADETSYETMADWVVYAPATGRLSGFNTKTGDAVAVNAKLGEITNDNVLHVNVPFSESQLQSIYIGQSAQLTSADFMTSNLFGTVTDISAAPIRSSDGSVLYPVEISIQNPGAITEGMSFTATIGGQLSPAAGTAELSEQETITSKGTGNVANVYVKDGDWVEEGQKVLELSNSSVYNTLERSGVDYNDLELTLQSQQKQLEDYRITSPITGTVVKKSSKAGDTVGQSLNSTVLATIADMSRMKFTMDVDELDIAKIQLGQIVEVSADALEGVAFVGVITQIQQEGESQNGVTTYPVEVTIDQPGELKIGMNVDASVVVESKDDVLKVPVEAIQKENGKSVVLVKGPDGTVPTDSGEVQSTTKSSSSSSMMMAGMSGKKALPPAEHREVTIGISSEDETEILSGLTEGEIIYVPSVGESNALEQMMMGAPSGGSADSGPPSGGGDAAPDSGASAR